MSASPAGVSEGMARASISNPAAARPRRVSSSGPARKTEGVTGRRPGPKWTLPTFTRCASAGERPPSRDAARHGGPGEVARGGLVVRDHHLGHAEPGDPGLEDLPVQEPVVDADEGDHGRGTAGAGAGFSADTVTGGSSGPCSAGARRRA